MVQKCKLPTYVDNFFMRQGILLFHEKNSVVFRRAVILLKLAPKSIRDIDFLILVATFHLFGLKQRTTH